MKYMHNGRYEINVKYEFIRILTTNLSLRWPYYLIRFQLCIMTETSVWSAKISNVKFCDKSLTSLVYKVPEQNISHVVPFQACKVCHGFHRLFLQIYGKLPSIHSLMLNVWLISLTWQNIWVFKRIYFVVSVKIYISPNFSKIINVGPIFMSLHKVSSWEWFCFLVSCKQYFQVHTCQILWPYLVYKVHLSCKFHMSLNFVSHSKNTWNW